MKKRVLSGNRPTGKLHLGNLMGAVSNWVQLQDEYDCYFEVADWHALTTAYEEPLTIRENMREMVLDWFSAGIDPQRSVVFIQSHILEHAELHIILSMLVSVSRLERNPTFKEQVHELGLGEQVNYGLLGYPVLQAADILIYRAHAVPVGDDQLPHLELTREIARRFNYLYGEIFPVPEAKLTKYPRLTGLDGRKMSKSYGNAIYLADDPDTIHKKVWNIVTDPQRIRLKDPGRPEVCNAFSLYKVFAGEIWEQVGTECRSAERGCTQCKKQLTEVLVDYLRPIQERRRQLAEDPDLVHRLLLEGTERAKQEARETMNLVRRKINIGRF